MLIRGKSWYTTRPAPKLRCPVSVLPSSPLGSPTDSPEAASFPCGKLDHRRGIFLSWARLIALPGPAGAKPQPSKMMRAKGLLNIINSKLGIEFIFTHEIKSVLTLIRYD